jgi:spore coat protein U-like protein
VKKLNKGFFFFVFLLLPFESQAACSVSTTSVNFGAYDVFSAIPADSTGGITVACNEAPPPTVTIAVGPSLNSGGFLPRQMKHLQRADLLNYNLFTDTTRSTVWGDGTQGTFTLRNKVFKNSPWVLTIYGRIPAGQDVSLGSYQDVLTVTINW